MPEMEPPSYSDDSYAERFLPGMTPFPDDSRIFQRPGFDYDPIAALGPVHFDGQTLAAEFVFCSGARGRLVIRPYREGVLRIQIAPLDEREDMPAPHLETSPMLLPGPEELPQVEFAENESTCGLTFAGCRLEIDKQPFCLRVRNAQGEVIFESETEKLVGRYLAPPAGLRRQNNAAWAFLSWHTRNPDRYFGLGEKFTRFEKTGTRATIWTADTCGSTTSDMSYKSVPVIFSTAGWALLLHSSYRSYWELGSYSYATGGLLVEESGLDLFLLLAPSLKEQVMAYTALTGRPALPPRWAFGLWMSRAAYRDRAQMLEVAQRLRDEEIPCDTFSIDPTWMERGYYNDIGVEVCNFNWDAAAWGEPQALFREFSGLDFGICLWINPYFSEDSPVYQEARHQGYLVRTLEGSIARLEFNLAAGIVDFTNPEAKAWWQEKLITLLQQGASVFKVDFGDRVPEDALFFNRKTGREMHNLYVHLYAQAVYEAVERVHGTGMLWRRPGYIGTQRYPGSWAGDTQVTWEGMAGALRGGLSAAFTGESLWSHDMGGFVGSQPSEELYIRWAQFGMLSPLARFHGTTPREPWHYGTKALEVVRHYARLRYSLLPYLLGYAQESVQDGLPMLRPMVLEFPGEPRIDAIDDQYLLGPDLLVAPVLQPGARSRPVYLPKGSWWYLDRGGSTSQGSSTSLGGGTSLGGSTSLGASTGQGGSSTPAAGAGSVTSLSAGTNRSGAPVLSAGPLTGGGFRDVDAPLESIPLLVRAGALIPRYRQVPQHLKGPTPRQWMLDLYPPDPGQPTRRHLEIHENGFVVTIDYRAEGSSGKLEISPAPLTLAVRLIDRRPLFLRAAGGVQLQPGDPTVTFSVDVTQGASIEFRT